jgi:hypothetical protein
VRHAAAPLTRLAELVIGPATSGRTRWLGTLSRKLAAGRATKRGPVGEREEQKRGTADGPGRIAGMRRVV